MKQQQRILNYLKTGRSLSRLNSWAKLGILEAPARISELRAQGYKITTKRKSIVNKYGERTSIALWTMEK